MSNKESVLELHKINKAILEKTAFMLLTVSTAAIGYILTQIKDEKWSTLMYLPLFSLLLISLSFCFGTSYLGSYAKLANINALYIQSNHPQEKLNLYYQLNDCINSMHAKNTLQFYSFIFGALSYAAYVFIGMFKA